VTHLPWNRSEPLAWAATEDDRDEQIAEAGRLQGQRIERVQYFTLDYQNMDHGPPRMISDSLEWSEPSWRYEQFDCFDFYLQLDTEDQRSFTVGWDPPSECAGLWLREGASHGEPFGSVAVWDVTASPRWAQLMGSTVSAVECRYRIDVDLPGWHNDLITLTISNQRVFVFLGGVDSDHSPTPSANNLMVMSDPADLPDWLSS
jgi:hypothetical protein